ncbi:MAG TPA: MFS transporter, partial [Paracoccaceae bacterium]|nr:MFS transporter [Paracoccaceae bacterium]
VSAVQTAALAPGAFLALRVVEGVSHLAIVVSGPVAISAAAAGRWQGAAMTLWSSFFGLAYAVLAVIGPPVLASGGLAALFLGHGVWMAGCAALVARLLPPDPPAAQGGAGGGILARHRAIYADPHLSGPALGFVFYTAAYVALLTLVPPLLDPALRAPVATAMPLLSIAVSLTLGVWLLRFLPAVGLAMAAYGAGIAGAVLFAFAPVAGALVLSGALGLAQGAHFAAIPQLNPAPGDRARAAGAIAQMGNLGTVTGTPVLAALIAGFGTGAVPAFSAALCAGGLAMHILLAARRKNLAGAG